MDDGHIKSTSIDGISMPIVETVLRVEATSSLKPSIENKFPSESLIGNSKKNDQHLHSGGLSKLIILIALFLLIVVSAFLWIANNSKPTHKTIPIGVSESFVANNNSFGINVFKNLVNDNKSNSNILISPASISSSLAMINNGLSTSGGRSALVKLLGYSSGNTGTVNQSNQALLQSLQYPDPKVSLSLDNSLWINNDYKLNPSFINVSSKYYQTAINSFNPKQGLLTASVNKWLTKNTKGSIYEVNSQLGKDDHLDLVTAAYFNGEWSNTFAASSAVSSFLLSSGSAIKAPFITQTGYFNYYQNNLITSLQIPYGQNQRLSMDIFMPNNMSLFLANIKASNLSSIVSRYQPVPGSIVMPQFNLSSKMNLNQLLESMGLDSLFSNASSLNGIAKGISLTNYISTADINVSKSGVVPTSSGSAIQPNFNLQLDKPFLFTIVDNSTKYILFIGLVNNPAS